MVLAHLGEPLAAAQLIAAIATVTQNVALRTGDVSGQATMAQVTQAVLAQIGA